MQHRLGALSTVALLGWIALQPPTASAQSDVSPPLRLGEAVREALSSNLELASRQRSLEAEREQIENERAALLPQVRTGARAQVIDSERSDDNRGNASERSLNLAAGVSQVLYDEADWASFQSQKHVYEEQAQELADFRLQVAQEAADAFLGLDRARALTLVHERNRELTASNLETTRTRVATGYSSERELLRWESQLAQDEQAVLHARTGALSSRFELNRTRNRPPESPVEVVPLAIEEYGFVYARPEIVAALSKPEKARAMRDLLARVGAARVPSVVALDAAIAAEERLAVASERSFWVPSLTAEAGVDHLADSGNASSEFDDFEKTEWIARATLTFPLFEGGGKFSKLRQSRERVASLRLARRSALEAVDQQIRTAFARSTAAHEAIGLAGRQEGAARKNYEFVREGYSLGVASILDLLDAQSQLLDAQVGSHNAFYDFFSELIAAERALALYPFLESPGDVDAVLDAVERELRGRP